MVLKAQQEPQLAWFLMGVTAPALTQSTLAGTVLLWYLKGLVARALCTAFRVQAAGSQPVGIWDGLKGPGVQCFRT